MSCDWILDSEMREFQLEFRRKSLPDTDGGGLEVLNAKTVSRNRRYIPLEGQSPSRHVLINAIWKRGNDYGL